MSCLHINILAFDLFEWPVLLVCFPSSPTVKAMNLSLLHCQIVSWFHGLFSALCFLITWDCCCHCQCFAFTIVSPLHCSLSSCILRIQRCGLGSYFLLHSSIELACRLTTYILVLEDSLSPMSFQCLDCSRSFTELRGLSTHLRY